MYDSNNVATNIKNMAKKKKIAISKMLQDIGLGINTMSNMKTSMPKADNLARVADYLDCSVDYLLGRSATPEINQPVKEQSEEITITYAAYGAGGKTVQKKVTPEIMEKINRLMSDD